VRAEEKFAREILFSYYLLSTSYHQLTPAFPSYFPMQPRIAVVYLSYKSGQYISEAISTLARISYPRENWEIIIVDNRVPGDNSAEVIKEKILPRAGVDLPKVTLLENQTNLGFAGGMNTGMREAMSRDFDYVLILNQDGEVSPTILQELSSAAESDPKIGAAQCFIRLHPETHLINGYGNELHYLCIGWSGGYRLPVKDARPAKIRDVAYASGAACMYRVKALRDVGLFDEVMFLYHEDTDLSWRLRLRDWRVTMIPGAEFFHKYEFNRSVTKFYWMLRNQLVVYLTLPRWRNILLTLPMQLVFQTATFGASLRNGYAREVLRAWGFFWKPSTWKYLLERRRKYQASRLVGDKFIYSFFQSEVNFQDADNWLLRNIGNPMMRGYWWLAKRFLKD